MDKITFSEFWFDFLPLIQTDKLDIARVGHLLATQTKIDHFVARFDMYTDPRRSWGWEEIELDHAYADVWETLLEMCSPAQQQALTTWYERETGEKIPTFTLEEQKRFLAYQKQFASVVRADHLWEQGATLWRH